MVLDLGCLIDHCYTGLQSPACSGNNIQDCMKVDAHQWRKVFWASASVVLQGEGQNGAAHLDCAAPPPAGTDSADCAGPHELCGGFQLVRPCRQAARYQSSCCLLQGAVVLCVHVVADNSLPCCLFWTKLAVQQQQPANSTGVLFRAAGHVSCSLPFRSCGVAFLPNEPTGLSLS